MIVVADLYKLKDRNKELYITNGTKTIERANMKVEKTYVDHVNSNSENNGKLFIVKEDETKEWEKARDINDEAKKEAEQKRKLGITEQAESLLERQVKKPVRKRRTKSEIEEDKQG